MEWTESKTNKFVNVQCLVIFFLNYQSQKTPKTKHVLRLFAFVTKITPAARKGTVSLSYSILYEINTMMRNAYTKLMEQHCSHAK